MLQNLFTSLLLLLSAGLSAQPGLLDPTFNGTGKLQAGIGLGSDEAKALLLQPDGKIVVAGRSITSSTYDFALLRLWPDGSPDPDFGANGRMTTAIGPANDEAYAVALQSDGKIVVAGRSFNGDDFDVAVARYQTNGLPDDAFGQNGAVTFAFGNNTDEAYAVAVQPDGKIVVAGYADNGGQRDFALARLLENGAPDLDFGTNGLVLTDFNGNDDQAQALAVQPDGRIVLAGWSFNELEEDFALARYLSNGQPDSSFNATGRVAAGFFSGHAFRDFGQALALQPDGKLVVAGYSITGTTQKMMSLARFQPDGSLDADFGYAGTVNTVVYNIADAAYAVAVQADGKIVIAGSAFNTISKSDFALVRYLPNGFLDNSFNNTGKVVSDFNVAYEKAQAVAIQSDGRILAAGDASFDFALARYLSGSEVGVADVSASVQALQVHPNPVTNSRFTLNYTLTKAKTVTLSLYDQQGRTCGVLSPATRQEAGRHQQILTLPAHLPAGAYRLVLTTEDGQLSLSVMK